ncbi:MAG: translation initiation factor IF-2 subunit gamma [Desulfurococcaceae archaeon]
MSQEKALPEVNIGVVGHVDHGKTTLVQALTGIWTAKHSREIERGMTIFLGYADGNIAYCDNMEPPDAFTTETVCPDGSSSRILRRVSYVDAPGHEAYMTTMLSGAMVIDGAILVISATEQCPQPQTIEHLMALEILGVKNLVVVQNKIDAVSKERALKNYNEILNFVKGTIAENAPIIPVSALHKVNIDVLLQAIQEIISTPERDLSKPPIMYVIRSFDINRPGTQYGDVQGGVLGGTLLQGKLELNDEITILPGVKIEKPGKQKTQEYVPLVTTIEEIRYGDVSSEEAKPGGLVAIRTKLDPSLAKADRLAGSVVTKPNEKLPVATSLSISYHVLERVVGLKAGQQVKLPPLQPGEKIIVVVGPATRLSTVKSVKKDYVDVDLSEPVVAWKGMRVAIGRRVMARWRLAGWGVVENVY